VSSAPFQAPPPAGLRAAVIVCTHNPRADYLRRTLDGLRGQSLPGADWELLLVDNASAEPVAGRIDLSWHPSARCVTESTLGLTSARLRGIKETTAPLLVFVDDDNVLAPDYLATAVEIGRSRPFLGAWGGRVEGVFEIRPPAFCLRHAHMLALRDVPRDLWGNYDDDFRGVPCGAGMCIRRPVAECWANDVKLRPAALQLGRIGKNLGACEDGHLALVSHRFGLGTGVFQTLVLSHLIPKERLTLDYFVRLAAGHAYSYNLLRHLLGQSLHPRVESGSERLLTLYRRWRSDPAERAIQQAMEQAHAAALRDLASFKQGENGPDA
jgi:glycosyltransferase involved in cell wall biosynthesis